MTTRLEEVVATRVTVPERRLIQASAARRPRRRREYTAGIGHKSLFSRTALDLLPHTKHHEGSASGGRPARRPGPAPGARGTTIPNYKQLRAEWHTGKNRGSRISLCP